MTIAKGLALAVLAVGALFIGQKEARAQAAVPPLFSVMVGGNEVSAAGVANVGDPDGHGSATVKIRGTVLCFALIVDQIDAPTAAHIHRGPAGVNGGIVVPLIAPPSGSPGTSSRCIRGLDPALLTDIRTNAASYYVNIHTGAFPSGAIRGQLF